MMDMFGRSVSTHVPATHVSTAANFWWPASNVRPLLRSQFSSCVSWIDRIVKTAIHISKVLVKFEV